MISGNRFPDFGLRNTGLADSTARGFCDDSLTAQRCITNMDVTIAPTSMLPGLQLEQLVNSWVECGWVRGGCFIVLLLYHYYT